MNCKYLSRKYFQLPLHQTRRIQTNPEESFLVNNSGNKTILDYLTNDPLF